ncbi:MAG TPA: hypothetical protein VK864_00825, partial [Longimicrobiales bacterium]|nr:hypothetical protein [Longimicrobiales bacterium]
ESYHADILTDRLAVRHSSASNARAGFMERVYRRAFIAELQEQYLAREVEADVGVPAPRW